MALWKNKFSAGTSDTAWIVALLLALLCVVLLAALVSAQAADVQQMAQQRGDQILDMLGPSGLFAILGSIVMVRAIRILWYFTKRMSFLTGMIISAIIGAGSAWAGAGADTTKEILAGAFLCMIGTPLTYEISKWAVALAYQNTKWKIWWLLYLFLCPKTLKTGAAEEQQDGELTQFFKEDKTEPKA